MKLLLTALMLISFSAFAHKHDKDEKMDFPTAQSEILINIDQRIAAMQEHKTCVTNAKSKDDLKACRKTMKEKRAGKKKDWKAHKKSKHHAKKKKT